MSPIRPPPRASVWRWGLAALLVLGVLAGVLWLRPEAPPDRDTPPPVRGKEARREEPPPSPLAPVLPVEGEALASALREERVVLPSGVVVEAIEVDRPWVCAGEVLGLSARVGGSREAGAVFRWVWPVAGGGAELHPGPTLRWRAPATPGRYAVRFQVAKDLGGRGVGVLAERDVTVDVRACGQGESQAAEPLHVGVIQRRPGLFAFHALYSGSEPVTAYVWDFGDGSTATTTESFVEHGYPFHGLALNEVKSFTVKLEARLARGGPLRASAFVQLRGHPPTEPPPVELQVSRWQPLPEGGWRSDVALRSPEGTHVTWDRLERLTLYWDGRVDMKTRPWTEVLRVEESLERGGFRGHVTVRPDEVPEDVKQVLDFLYGHDAQGQEVVVSWSPFKREPRDSPAEDAPPPPRK